MSQSLIIVGAGLAGWTTAREFRKLDTTMPVFLVTADSGDFYAKPSLSNAFAQGRLPAQLVSTPAAKMAETLNVTLLAHTRVEAIDTAAQTLSVRSAARLQTLAFSSLVLATGAQAIRVPVQGDAADAVMSINSLDDFAAFHARLQAGAESPGAPLREVLIMGAGLIGCEFANDLAQAGMRVRAVDQAAGQLQVTLTMGESVPADAVLSAIGLRADTALAQAAGLLVDRAIVVNTFLQTSAAHIYALGDCAQYASAPSLLSMHGSTLPYVMPIMSAARALAATLAGTPTALAFALMPVSVKTPALPLVVAAAQTGLAGHWAAAGEGIWHWLDDAGQPRGFVLAGAQTSQRMAQAKLLAT